MGHFRQMDDESVAGSILFHTFVGMNNLKPYIVTFTGHRIYSRKHDMVIERTVEELYAAGSRRFRVGMAEGFDIAVALIVLRLKQMHGDVELELFVPWPNFSCGFSPTNKRLYSAIVEQATLTHYVANDYFAGVYQKRNEAMVDGADLVVAWWDGRPSGTANTVRYAHNIGCPVKNIYDFQQLELKL